MISSSLPCQHCFEIMQRWMSLWKGSQGGEETFHQNKSRGKPVQSCRPCSFFCTIFTGRYCNVLCVCIKFSWLVFPVNITFIFLKIKLSCDKHFLDKKTLQSLLASSQQTMHIHVHVFVYSDSCGCGLTGSCNYKQMTVVWPIYFLALGYPEKTGPNVVFLSLE